MNARLNALTLDKPTLQERVAQSTREEWLMKATRLILSHIATLGYSPTGEVRVALGVPPATRSGKALGVCYHASASEGAYREIFIHPELTDTRMILGVLTHEIGHAVLPDGVGHRKPFADFCRAVGFTFTKAAFADDGEAWWDWASDIANYMGQMPHKKLNTSRPVGAPKKQTTRNLLVKCPVCGMSCRTSRKNLLEILANSRFVYCMQPVCDGTIDIQDLLDNL